MANAAYEIVIRLLLAVVAGGLIGLERNYHGRPAGFRTHTLVCTGATLIMLLTLFNWEFPAIRPRVGLDPTRLVQGITTGIGFLGAGVIIKEGLSVRGLTTAASVWTTAAIGVLFGIGFYLPAIVGTVLVLGVLSAFRALEAVIPALHYGRLNVRFAREHVLSEPDLIALINRHRIGLERPAYALMEGGSVFEYQLTIRTRSIRNYARLARTLNALPDVLEFRIQPTGD